MRSSGWMLVLTLGACSYVDVVDDGSNRSSTGGDGGASTTVAAVSATAVSDTSASTTVGSTTVAATTAASSSSTGCVDGLDLCDGVDNDCDGSIDEDDPVGGTLCDTGMTGPCGEGTWVCAGGIHNCETNATPAPEVCDNADNDCNGIDDDGLFCPAKRVFVTSQLFTGNFGGLLGGDTICQILADAAGLNGVFKAWLSTTSEDARDRMYHAGVAYELVDGTKVADNWNDLVDGSLDASISLTEVGGPAPMGTTCPAASEQYGPPVWTGTIESGVIGAVMETCGGWITSNNLATVGCAADDIQWSECCNASLCSLTAALYCFEQ